MKLLFVVHRTYPYNGGSEYNVKVITEELSKSHSVHVLADTIDGNYGNVNVTSNRSYIFKEWDLVVIHGADMPTQDYALQNITKIPSKILYWIIKPSTSPHALLGMEYSTFIGYGSSFDYSHICKFKKNDKSIYIRYAIDEKDSIGIASNELKDKKVYISSGGFAPHKGFEELALVFKELNLENAELKLYGYIGDGKRLNGKNIISKIVNNRQSYLNELRSSDLYIMNSYDEGYGLVILDCMLNKIPWIGRDIAGCHDLKEFGDVYSTKEQLKLLIKENVFDKRKIEKAYDYILKEHTPYKMANDLLSILC